MTQKSSDSSGPIDQDAMIARLLGQVAELTARSDKLEAENAALKAENAALHARVVELQAKLTEPPKTPGNSSTPPSQGRKASDVTGSKPKTCRTRAPIARCIRTRQTSAK